MALSTINYQLPTSLALLLLVLRVRADHPHDAFAANDLTVLTNPLDAGSHFHDSLTVDENLTFQISNFRSEIHIPGLGEPSIVQTK